MTTTIGIVINCILVCFDDEDEDFQDNANYNRTTFYEISTVYSVVDGVYGTGSIIVSGGYEYFTKLPDYKIHEVIRKSKKVEAQENFKMFLN